MSLSEKTNRWLNKQGITSLAGKTVLVTGSNSGVGYKNAEIVLSLGANVILACRNPERAEAAREELLRDYPGASVSVMQLDIASFASIDAFAEKLKEDQVDIDAFVNNAGVFHQPGKTTAEGFELVLGTNYLGVYYLTEKILPYLRSLPHEVFYINTISMVHKIAKVDYRDFYYKEHYSDFPVYARSKLCLAKFTYALAEKYRGSNIKIYMNHPGMTITPLGRNAFPGLVSKLEKPFSPLFNTPEKSALSVAYILSKDLPVGSIIGPNALFGGWGYPKKNHICRKVKTGAEELIRFTQEETEKKQERLNEQERL
ncbi:MAG: SDR family NAD(P)-dependent oxidoreductase [Lachnospiraceae bacterium]|nr:SDR family NAD(P)-dependent oxidoreductase [Lachnospiraceae bacterium]